MHNCSFVLEFLKLKTNKADFYDIHYFDDCWGSVFLRTTNILGLKVEWMGATVLWHS